MKKFAPDQLVLARECKEAVWRLKRYDYGDEEDKYAHFHNTQDGRSWKDADIVPYEGNEYLHGRVGQLAETFEPEAGQLVAVQYIEQNPPSCDCKWYARVFHRMSSLNDEVYRYLCFSEETVTRIEAWKYCEPLEKHFLVKPMTR